MTKTYFSFLFLINVITLFAQYDDPYQYYPMATGNYWYYSNGPGSFSSLKIYADSTDRVGNRFYWPYSKDIFNFPFYCIDTNYFFIIRPTSQINTKEYLYKLDAEVGDWWWVWRGDSADTNTGTWCQLGGVLDGSYLGVPTRIKSYLFYIRVKDNNQYYDYWDHTEKLAYGMGLIYRDNDANYPSYLVGAIINGKVIGNPVNVEETPEKLPDTFELFQNFPNPFNPNTTVKFKLPASGNVKLTILSVLGEKIADVMNSYLTEGTHEVNIDFSKYQVGSGVYIYLVNYKNQKTIKKMMYLK